VSESAANGSRAQITVRVQACGADGYGTAAQLGIHDRVKEAGPRIIFYELENGEDVTVFLALPVTEPPTKLPAPARYRVLPEIEAAVAVRRCPAASIFPAVWNST
jgi:hypothetical protein